MRKLLVIATLALGTAGCIEFDPATVTPARGRAYFVRRSLGSSLWICDAATGTPLCYEATGHPAAPAQ